MIDNYGKIIFDYAKQILSIPSPSGYTHEVIEKITELVQDLGYETKLTKKGNLLIEVKGKTDKIIGLSGHVDTLGAMVKSITSDGQLKFTTIGGPIWP
jgi:putative aminopeptidase FrvX